MNAVTRDTVALLPLLDVGEAAAFLNVCRATVRREAIRGRLRGQKVGQRWRFAREDLLAYLDSTRAVSVAERVAHIEEVVKAAPPLRPEQIARLSALFDWQRGGDLAQDAAGGGGGVR